MVPLNVGNVRLLAVKGRLPFVLIRFDSAEGADGAVPISAKRLLNIAIERRRHQSGREEHLSLEDSIFIVLATNSEEDDEAMTLMGNFASKLSGSIKTSSGEPSVLTRLPFAGRVHGSEKLIAGPLAIKRSFPAPNIGALCSHTSAHLHGALADYQTQEPYRERLKLLLLQFATSEAANKAYIDYVAALQEQHSPLASGSATPQSSFLKSLVSTY